jgi:hypothetical protein
MKNLGFQPLDLFQKVLNDTQFTGEGGIRHEGGDGLAGDLGDDIDQFGGYTISDVPPYASSKPLAWIYPSSRHQPVFSSRVTVNFSASL